MSTFTTALKWFVLILALASNMDGTRVQVYFALAWFLILTIFSDVHPKLRYNIDAWLAWKCRELGSGRKKRGALSSTDVLNLHGSTQAPQPTTKEQG